MQSAPTCIGPPCTAAWRPGVTATAAAKQKLHGTATGTAGCSRPGDLCHTREAYVIDVVHCYWIHTLCWHKHAKLVAKVPATRTMLLRFVYACLLLRLLPLSPYLLPCSSIVCQRKDWGSNHKFECDNLQKLAAHAAAAAAGASGNGRPASSSTVSKPPPLDPNEDAPVPRQVLFPYQHYLQLCHNRTSCRKQPIGLTNHGNNCYANCALQCLLASRPLRAYLDQGLHSRDCNKPGNEWCLLCQLQVRLGRSEQTHCSLVASASTAALLVIR
jgi:hypothetical protein